MLVMLSLHFLLLHSNCDYFLTNFLKAVINLKYQVRGNYFKKIV